MTRFTSLLLILCLSPSVTALGQVSCMQKICPVFEMGPGQTGFSIYYAFTYTGDTCSSAEPTLYEADDDLHLSNCVTPDDCDNCEDLHGNPPSPERLTRESTRSERVAIKAQRLAEKARLLEKQLELLRGPRRGRSVEFPPNRSGRSILEFATLPYTQVDVPVPPNFPHNPNDDGTDRDEDATLTVAIPPFNIQVPAANDTDTKYARIYCYRYVRVLEDDEEIINFIGYGFESQFDSGAFHLNGGIQPAYIRRTGDGGNPPPSPHHIDMHFGALRAFVLVDNADEWPMERP